MANPYKIGNMPDAERTFVRWLIDSKDVAIEAMDINPNGTEKAIEFEEAVAFAMKTMPWQEYMPRLEQASPFYKHPLDDRNYPPQIKSRMELLMAMSEMEIDSEGILSTDPYYCHELQKRFFDLAGPSFEKGGLCLAYDYSGGYHYDLVQVSAENMHNLTSQEFFENCMAPSSPGTYMGSCTENTQARIAAFQNHPICRMDMMITEQHVYPVTSGMAMTSGEELDGSQIGMSGWAVKANPAVEYYNISGTGKIASMIEPDVFADIDLFASYVEDYYSAIGTDVKGEMSNPDLCDPATRYHALHSALNVLDVRIKENSKTIMPFLTLSKFTASMEFEYGLEIALEVLKKWPDNPHSLMPLLNIMDLRNDDNVRQVVEILDRELPRSGLGHTIDGYAALAAGDARSALRTLNIALNRNPGNMYALAGIANLAFSMGRYEAAENALSRINEISPNLPGIHMLAASIAQIKGDLPTALTEAKKEATIFVGNMNAILLHAQLATSMGRPLEAIHLLDSFLQSNPYLSREWRVAILGQMIPAYDLYGETDTALDIFYHLYDEDLLTPDQTLAISLQLYISYSSLDKAEEIATYMSSQNPLMTAYVGMIRAARYDHVAAERIYESLKREYADYPIMDHLRLAIESSKGHREKSRKLLERILAKNPYDFSAQSMLVSYYISTGDIEAARAQYEDLKKSFPNVFDVKAMEPMFHMVDGRFLEAKLHAEELLDKKPRMIELLSVHSLASLKLGDLDVAMDSAERALAILPEDPSLQALIAAIHLEMGELEQAERFATEASKNWIETEVNYIDDPQTILGKIETLRARGTTEIED